MPLALDDMEQKILDYMVQYLRENTYQPSIREIGERFGIKSTKTVSEHLQSLATKGYLERDPSRSRGVRILDVDLNPQAVSVPCYSRLPEDPGPGSSEGADSYLTLDRRLVGEKGSFFVQARNGDLSALGVSEGDYILLSPTTTRDLKDGSLVMARVGDAPGYYRCQSTGKRTVLRSLTAGEATTEIDELDSVAVLGKVTAVYRKLDGLTAGISVTAH